MEGIYWVRSRKYGRWHAVTLDHMLYSLCGFPLSKKMARTDEVPLRADTCEFCATKAEQRFWADLKKEESVKSPMEEEIVAFIKLFDSADELLCSLAYHLERGGIDSSVIVDAGKRIVDELRDRFMSADSSREMSLCQRLMADYKVLLEGVMVSSLSGPRGGKS